MAILSLRYGSNFFSFRDLLIRLCGLLQKKKVVILKSDSLLCQKIMESSNRKGSFIEQLIALPAWDPILSIESSDGDEWQKLIQEFRWIYSKIDWQEQLPHLCSSYVQKWLKAQGNNSEFFFDGESVSRFCAQVFFQCLFQAPLDQESEDLYYQASLEWRKEIALKGKGNFQVKKEFMNHLLRCVKKHPVFNEKLGSAEDTSYFLSAIAQPFLLSPQINFSDILATLFLHLEKNKEQQDQFFEAIESEDENSLFNFLYEAIYIAHPFPVLERELTKSLSFEGKTFQKGSQIFIVLDEFQHSKTFSPRRWAASGAKLEKALLFGAGPRICPGRQLGLQVMSEMLRVLTRNISWNQIKPYFNHDYSGRENDRKENFTMLLYQARVFSRVLWNSYQLGRNQKS